MMRSKIHELAERIQELEEELDAELTRRRESIAFVLKGRKVQFDREIAKLHRSHRRHLLRYLLHSNWLTYLTAPVIYAQIVPIALLDLSVTVYQAVCFPVYGMPKVHRSRYVVLDRHQLGYLNAVEKLNCGYCGYANGVLAYAREIASRTEQYWCPIKHASKVVQAHARYKHFLEFGDAEGYRERLDEIREAVRSA